MDETLTDLIESLLTGSGTGSTSLLGRQLITLVGFMADKELPADINEEVTGLSKLLVQQEVLGSLIQSLNINQRSRIASTSERAGVSGLEAHVEQVRLIDQIETVSSSIAACAPVNYARLTAWVVTQAREKKILRSRPRR